MERIVRNVLDWVAIPSVTGAEAAYGEALARECRRIGLATERQEIASGRANVLARGARPRVVLCTHIDTVPGDLGVREDREHVYGRGSCDAKGPASAMLHALERILASGEDRVGVLFTVGEETDSAGAAFADRALAEPWDPAFTVIGEPTDNRFVAAGKGIWKARLVASGSAGHSSQVGGPSAVHELVGCVHGLLRETWGTHPVLGHGTLNVGTISGGVAPNVVAEHAECEVLVRAVDGPDRIAERVARHLGAHVRVEKTHTGYGPIDFDVPTGEAGIPVAFGTDAPHLRRWGRPLLYGPGSILDAHTDHEKVAKRALDEAAARYETLVRDLLLRVDAS